MEDTTTPTQPTVLLDMKVERKPLLKAVTAAKAIARGNDIPILDTVLLTRDGNGQLAVVANNLIVETITVMDAWFYNQTNHAGCVDAGILESLLKNGTSDEVTIRIEQTETYQHPTCAISCGLIDARIHAYDANDFPRWAQEPRMLFAVPAKDMLADLKRVAPFVSKDDSRYYLKGVLFEGDEEERVLNIVATDGHRMARIQRPAEAGSGIGRVIVPTETVKVLLKALTAGKDTLVYVYTADGMIRFDVGLIQIRSKLIDGTYPDVNRIIIRNQSDSYSFDAATMAKSVAVVTKIRTEKDRAFKIVGAQMSEGGFTKPDTDFIYYSSPYFGDMKVRVEATATARFPVVGFNAKYMKDMLAIMTGKVRIQMSSGDAPALVTCEDAPELTFVQMPMRV